jgi:hypothetical protein
MRVGLGRATGGPPAPAGSRRGATIVLVLTIVQTLLFLLVIVLVALLIADVHGGPFTREVLRAIVPVAAIASVGAGIERTRRRRRDDRPG